MENKINMFVYGTLMQGLGNHKVLGNSRFISKAKTKGLYALFALGIPYVTKSVNKDRIHGEVYEVNETDLVNVDRLEGHPRFYKREQIDIELENGDIIEAWIYFCDVNTKSVDYVVSGNYWD